MCLGQPMEAVSAVSRGLCSRAVAAGDVSLQSGKSSTTGGTPWALQQKRKMQQCFAFRVSVASR